MSPLNDAPYSRDFAHGGRWQHHLTGVCLSRSWKQKPQQGVGEATSELRKVRARLRNWP